MFSAEVMTAKAPYLRGTDLSEISELADREPSEQATLFRLAMASH